MQRRNFIKTTTIGNMGIIAAPVILTGEGWKGANDRVNVAVIGIRGMGQSHIQSYQKLKNVEVAALCDVDENLFAERVKKHFTDKGLREPRVYSDMRRVFDDKSIDAVSIVTPNHWHALAGILAIQAGKHASIEKPSCHTVMEGKKLIEAAKKYGVVVQDGAEQRSNPCAQSAVKFMREGNLGEVYLAKGVCYKWRDSIGKYPDGYMQEGEKYASTLGSSSWIGPFTRSYMARVNYDMWLGPAPLRPFNRNRFHYNWQWYWDYGNGDMGNQGVHEMDIARWGLGVTIPERVSATGGHMMFDDDQETPNVLMAVFEFPDKNGGGDKKKIMQFEVRHWMTNPEGNHLGSGVELTNTYMTSSANVVGNIFYGSKGYLLKDVSSWQAFMGKERAPGASGKGEGNHYQNFIDAIRADDPSLLTAPVEEGFYSCALIHLANISYRLGRTLNIDTKTLSVINDDEAGRMLSKEYRKPYELPAKV
ncbi:MAG: Gfo/Idh/MocA family oxidoreductase [Bacteroidales bacterium]|nr:Gfo/Idh/MocA family oxidoreductase [Bacteroidales bacterium]